MRNVQGERRRIYVDGEEYPGLIAVGDVNNEKDKIDVPGYDKVTKTTNGVRKVPDIPLTYRIDKNSETLPFYRNWYLNNEEHDVKMERVNHKGDVFETILYPGCLLGSFNCPGYDAGAPTAAQFSCELIPDDEQVVS